MWASHNFFGKRYAKDDAAYSQWKSDYRAQLRGLEQAAFAVNFNGEFKPGSCVVTIEPAVLFEFSKVTLSISFKREVPTPGGVLPLFISSTASFHDKDLKALAGNTSGPVKVTLDGQRITRIEIRGEDSKPEVFDEVDVDLNVDLYDDGRTHRLAYQTRLTSSLWRKVVRYLDVHSPSKSVEIGSLRR